MNQKTKSKRKQGAIESQAGSQWPKRFRVIGAAAVVVGLSAAVLLSSTPIRGVPDGTQSIAIQPPSHVEGDLHDGPEVPAGGPHSAVWQDCGFYDREVRSENAVHSLEHGAVWITYQPDLAEDQMDRLRRFTSPSEKVLVSVVSTQTSPIVATAWGTQLELDDANDTRLEQFVNEFTRGLTVPEPGGLCSGGVQ